MKKTAIFLAIILIVSLFGGCGKEETGKTIYVLTEELLELSADGVSQKMTLRYAYDKNNIPTQVDTVSNGQTYRAATMACDENGLITKKTVLQPDGSFLDEVQFFYDAAGNLLKEQHYFKDGKRNSEKIWTYDAAGRPLSLEEYTYPYDQQGNLMDPSVKSHLTCTTRWTYDTQGRILTQEMDYEKVGLRKADQKITYTYDDEKGIHTVLDEIDGEDAYDYETVITLGADKKPVSSITKYIRPGDPRDGKVSSETAYEYNGTTVVKTTRRTNGEIFKLAETVTETYDDQGMLVSIETKTYEYSSLNPSDRLTSTAVETYNAQGLLTDVKITSNSREEHYAYTYKAIQVPENSLRESGLSDIQRVDY